MTPIRIVLASDEGYTIPLAASMRSIIDTSLSPYDIEIVILSCGISAASRERLLLSSDPIARKIHFVEVDENKIHELPVPAGNLLSSATYARLFLPELLPAHWERVIYLDVDTITLCPLNELWDTNLNGMPLAAIQDFGVTKISSRGGVSKWREMGLDVNANYFNSGVLLLDIAALKREEVCKNALDYLNENSKTVQWYDQEALNAAINGRFVVLDQAWNVMWYWFTEAALQAEAHDVLSRAKIRHFSGAHKPWCQNKKSPWGTGHFFKYIDRTAWRGWRP
jgi:lipopolysaccharide biosynthesis glycosyltransferase